MTYETVGVSTSTSLATAVASSTTADTKGSWVELDASTAFAVDGFWVFIGHNSSTSNLDVLVDIGTGAASSEVVLVPDLLYSTGDAFGEAYLVYIPMAIASGTRLSARCQDGSTSALTIKVAMIITTDSGLDITAFTNMDALGADTAATGGASIDPGAVANVKGNYVELVASSAQNYKAVLILIGQHGISAMGGINGLFDVAIGAADSEVDFLENLSYAGGAQADSFQPKMFGPYACDIPSSSRISVRSQATTNSTPLRLMDIVIYGFN